MKTDEANKIIAEYMGLTFCGLNDCVIEVVNRSNEPNYIPAYSHSLDALVPVWEKLRADGNWCLSKSPSGDRYWFELEVTKNSEPVCIKEHLGKTIQEAAAIATAKAIQELGE